MKGNKGEEEWTEKMAVSVFLITIITDLSCIKKTIIA
jgi:hypothetical protein